MTLTQEIRAKAQKFGFEKIGISRAETLDERNGLEEWLAKGQHGEMHWMGRDPRKRIDPLQVLNEAQSVLALGPELLHSIQTFRTTRAWEDFSLRLGARLSPDP